MTNTQFIKLIIPYFYEKPIELYIEDDLIPTDLEMIRFKALNCLASEKERDEIIRDMKHFLTLTGIKPVTIDPNNTSSIIEFPIIF
ncbi:MAG: hypothetical protein ACTSQF_05210 [Candidatus Heimdallarchaeaceae archaeon]